MNFIKRGFNSSIGASWLNTGIRTIYGILIIPLAITKFDTATLSVWFLFSTVIALSEAVVFGFNSTFIRFISYTFSGINYNEFENLNEQKTEQIILKDQLNEVYSLMNKIFLFISILYLFVLIIGGSFALAKPISYTDQESILWIAWIFIVFANFIRVRTYHFQVYIQGMHHVANYQKINTIFAILQLIINPLILVFYPSLLFLSISNALILSTNSLIFYFNVKNINNNHTIRFYRREFNPKLFKIVWHSAWKSGITKILAPIIYQISGIILSQFGTPKEVSSYLFTQRIFDIIRNFSDVTFTARIPQIASLRAKCDFKKLIPYLKQTILISYSIYFLGFILLISAGSFFLHLLKSNTELGNPMLIALFSIAYFISRWSGIQLNISNQSNQVIEHIAIFIYALVFFPAIIVLFNIIGVYSFPLGMILAQFANGFYIQKYTYPNIQSSFFKFEKNLSIPAFLLLVIIIVLYLIF